MKFSTTLAMGLAPVALARQVRSVYPPSRRDGHLVGGVEMHEGEQKGHEVVEPPKQEHEVVEPPKQEHEVVQEAPKHEPVQVADPEQWKKDDQKLIDDGYGVGHKEEIIIIWAEKPEEDRVNYHEQQTVTETVTEVAEHQQTPPPEVHPPEAAATHTVVVGGPDGLIFQPEELHDVPMGDMVIFEFLAMNHTVTQSTFDVPCEAMEGGMDSGHQPNPENNQPAPQVAMQVTTSDPLWFYCKTGDHCAQGMVFSINPTEENTHAIFKETAIKDNGDGADTPITGGEPPANDEEGGEEGGEEPTPSPEPEAPEAPEQPEPPVGGGEATKPGQGKVGEDGACHCMVACDMGAGWPAPDQQGLGAAGGMSGALDMSQGGGVGLRRR